MLFQITWYCIFIKILLEIRECIVSLINNGSGNVGEDRGVWTPYPALEIPTGPPVWWCQFGGGPGTFCWFFLNFIFMNWNSSREDLQLFWLSFKYCHTPGVQPRYPCPFSPPYPRPLFSSIFWESTPCPKSPPPLDSTKPLPEPMLTYHQ